VGNIPELALPANFDCIEPTDLIVATYGSALFGVGYHSWLISTKDEHTLLHKGGPDDGAPLYMTSYRSELGGICAGLAVIGLLARSGHINIRTAPLVCDNEAAIRWCNQKPTSSTYHNTEIEWDLLKTFHSLQDEWCKAISTKVQWVKGHADRGYRALTRDEWLNIEADLLADKIREEKRPEVHTERGKIAQTGQLRKQRCLFKEQK
jgi:hypothetical protein